MGSSALLTVNIQGISVLENQPLYGSLELSAIRDLFSSLAKTVRAVRQYPPHHQVAVKFYEDLHQRFGDCLAAIEGMDIQVNLDYLTCGDEVVYHSDSVTDNLASVLHRDGIRSIRFNPGLEPDEINRFVNVLARAEEGSEDTVDIVNELWEADLRHIHYEAVDDLEYSDLEEQEQVRNSILQESAKNASDSGGLDIDVWSGNAAEEAERTEASQRAAQLTFGGLIRHTASDLEAIERLVSDDRQKDVKHDVINLMMQLCAYETSIQDLSLILEALQSAYDRLIRNGSFATLTEILAGLKRLLSERRFSSDRFERRLTDFHQRCGDMVRIKMITKRLNENPETDVRPLEEYFRHIGWESLNNMIWMLGELEHYPARRVLCDSLVEKCRDQIQLIGGAIYDSRWYVVRNVAMIIGETGMSEGIAYLQRAARHSDARVRVETARALSRIDGEVALKELLKLLDDTSERVRATAVNGIARLKEANAFEYLRDLVCADSFVERKQTTMRELLEALIRSDERQSLEVLVQLLKKTSFFKRAKIRKMQEAVVMSLEAAKSAPAEKILSAIATSKDSRLADIASRILSARNSGRGKQYRTTLAGGGVK